MIYVSKVISIASRLKKDQRKILSINRHRCVIEVEYTTLFIDM